ncbi:hypothetical protein EK21DRAFT_63518 [Setomelanomma holmii]|uniref:Uncharacterized protein n=1 Tax=Setomelanomma holmii TaxID=210430 RepID=A0A9P4HCM6_9PLEO|nr:hypothetical protein EK21DRAFT_63518 [Setomelanomma holmii]
MYGKFPDASCGASSNFFSCTAGSTFWGCCKSNACAATPAATCKDGDLVPAFMERPEQFNAYAPSATPEAKSGSNGAIIGGAVGGGVAAAIIIGVLIFFFCRRKKRSQHNLENGATASTPMMKERDEAHLSVQYGGQSPPPTYSSPNPNFYGNVAPSKVNPYQQPYQEYRHEDSAPQELPAENSSPVEHRYSELPAESSSSKRYSELPAGARSATAELESPQASPRPLQSEFSTDLAKQANQGLGVTEDRPRGKN